MCLKESCFKQVLHMRLTVEMGLLTGVYRTEYINAELYVVDILLKYKYKLMCA